MIETATTELAIRLLKAGEVAAQLQISRRTVYNLITRGELAACRVAGAIRIHPADLVDYVTRLRQASRLPDGQPVAGG